MKHRFIIIGLVLFFLLIPMVSFAGKAYYVDPGAPGKGNGSFSNPWNSIAQVNNHVFSTSDKLYFRAGTTLVMTSILRVGWNGTEQDPAVIGAYHIDNGKLVVGLGGNARPILSGNDWAVPGRTDTGLYSYNGLVHLNSGNFPGRRGPEYVTVQDLEIYRSGGAGISISRKPDDPVTDGKNIIRNCFIQYSLRRGIEVARISHNIVEGNTTQWTSYGGIYNNSPPNHRITGAAIEITAMERAGMADHNVVRNNTVSYGWEGIGIYKQARYTFVENNTVFNCATYNIYVTRGRANTITGNLVYSTPQARSGPNWGRGIYDAVETHSYPTSPPTGHNQIYNNYIAGLNVGIGLGMDSGSTVGHIQQNIWGNRLVDNARNFYFSRDDILWEDNQIQQNYSFVFTATGVHTNKTSPHGVTWTKNFFNSSVSGNAAKERINEKIVLSKESGWRNLQAGEVERNFFSFVDEKLPAEKIIPRVGGFTAIGSSK